MALWFSDPFTPVAVMEKFPVGPECSWDAVVTVMVEDPEPVIVDCANVALAPAGKPDAPSITVPVKPFTAITVTVQHVQTALAVLQRPRLAHRHRAAPTRALIIRQLNHIARHGVAQVAGSRSVRPVVEHEIHRSKIRELLLEP